MTGTLDHLFDPNLLVKWNAYNFKEFSHIPRGDKLAQGIITRKTLEEIFKETFISFKDEEWTKRANKEENSSEIAFAPKP